MGRKQKGGSVSKRMMGMAQGRTHILLRRGEGDKPSPLVRDTGLPFVDRVDRKFGTSGINF